MYVILIWSCLLTVEKCDIQWFKELQKVPEICTAPRAWHPHVQGGICRWWCWQWRERLPFLPTDRPHATGLPHRCWWCSVLGLVTFVSVCGAMLDWSLIFLTNQGSLPLFPPTKKEKEVETRLWRNTSCTKIPFCHLQIENKNNLTWRKYAGQIGSFPRGGKYETNWNHHLVRVS